MWMKRPMGRLGGLRGWALAGLLLLGAGCRDGYSSADQEMKAPSEMTGKELLAEMNKIGTQRHLGREWRYRLEPGCMLEVTAGHAIAGGDRQVVPMAQAIIETRVDSTDKTYDVQVRRDGTDDGAVSVLEGGKWTDSVAMRSLLQHLQRRCSETEARTP